MKCDACPVHPVGFIDLSYGVKFEVRKHFIREGAYFTGVLGAGSKFRAFIKQNSPPWKGGVPDRREREVVERSFSERVLWTIVYPVKLRSNISRGH